MIQRKQQKQNILSILHNQGKVYTVMEATVYCFLMLQKYIYSKKNSEIKDYALCLGNFLQFLQFLW